MSDEIKAKKVYGIDLGTTYSAIAVVDDTGKAEVVKNMEGDPTTPSAIFFEAGDEVGKPTAIVGKVAKAQAGTDPERFVDFVKPHMGETDTKDENGAIITHKTTWTIEGITWTPEMISAEILKKLVKGVEITGEKVEDVVITCPAYFNDAQRRATSDAGKIAGLNVLAIINEPTAAALHYGLNKDCGNQTVIVYDLGGGTFDVTVVKISAGEIEVVCSDGDHNLGGKNWDEKLVEHLAKKFAEENGVSVDELTSDPETKTDLRIAAEVVKTTLSQRQKITQKVNHAGASVRIEVTRETFNSLTKPLLDQTEEITQRMINMARSKGVTQFDKFLLVGGSTKMPQVMEMVKEKFGSVVSSEPMLHDPDEAVAKGAALYGTIMATIQLVNQWLEKGKSKEEAQQIVADETGMTLDTIVGQTDIIIRNVASRSYGIQVKNKSGEPVVFNLIHKQDHVPAEGSHDFPLSGANASKLPLKVWENENLTNMATLDESTNVGQAEMLLTPGLPDRAPFRIIFKLDNDGVLAFEAIDLTNNKNLQTTFKPEGALTEEEIKEAQQTVGELVATE